MIAKSVRITPDAAHPEGGYAVIRLDGVWLLQDKATFSISPDGSNASAQSTSLSKEQTPHDVRTTSRGIELVIGPDVVDAIEVEPGTNVIVRVPAAEIVSKVPWPELHPKNEYTSAGLSKPENGEIHLRVQKQPEAKTNGANGSNNGQPTNKGLASLQLAKYGPAERSEARRARERAEALGSALKRNGPARRKTEFNEFGKVSTSITGKTGSDLTSINDSVKVGLPAAIRQGRSSGISPMTIFGAGLVATGAILLAAWINVTPITAPGEVPSMTEILAVGDISPLGIDSRSFSRDDALLLANQFVHGIERKADKVEGSFWLRKALSLKLSNEQMTWALTQLGTIYANGTPERRSDYQSARMLWDLAGANGDPMSLCFVGRLYEKGLGVTKNLGKARASYLKAQGLGGCPGLDQALSRVGQ